jgi:peptidyl-prolyl cis-trans isomerase A (cyclophilin A)
MPSVNCRRAALLIAAALLLSGCEENAKSDVAPPPGSGSAAANNSGKQTAALNDDDDDKNAGAAAKETKGEEDEEKSPALLDPSLAEEKAPDTFRAKFTTTKGDFVIEVTRKWAPNGADRFYNMVKIGYLNDVAFFRNIEGFMVQFGINGDPKVNKKWRDANIKDDPVVKSNTPGYVTFAQSSARNSRSTQVFINFGDNSRLDRDRFAPFGKVVEGMDVVKSLYNVYGEGAPNGRGPDQQRVQLEGNTYLKKSFPKLDYIKKAVIVEE